MGRKLNLYVDGFNLYYGLLQGNTGRKWLDLEALARAVFPTESLNRIRYFSARISGERDSAAPTRQDAYLRAIGANPKVTVHLGTFLSHDKAAPLSAPPASGAKSGLVYLEPGGKRGAWVRKTEEKGSDVNLATYLLLDGMDQDYEVAVVLSNDSDLATPIRMARERFGVVGVLCPHRIQSRELKQAASWQQLLYPSYIRRSQFPDDVVVSGGVVRKPRQW